MPRSKRRVHNRRKSRSYKKRSYKKRMHKKRRTYHKKQRGGFNKTTSGNTSYFTMDHRYRPFGSVTDSVMYHGKSLVGGIEGSYKPVNPNVSTQPIGQSVNLKDLKFGSSKL